MSWMSYPPTHMTGFDKSPQMTTYNVAPRRIRAAHPADFLEAR